MDVLVDWNADGDYTDTYDDITGDSLSMSWSRGRDYASQLIGRTLSGMLTVTVVNEDGKYSPSNTSSVLAGNLLPGRPITVRTSLADFPYTFPISFSATAQWTGRIERITPSPASLGLKTAVIEAFGVLGYLNQFAPQLSTATNRRTDLAIGDILDDVGWATADRTLDTGLTTIGRFWVSGGDVMDALQSLEEVEAGFIIEGKDGKVVFQNRYHRLTEATSTTSQATFSDASGAANSYVQIVEDDPLSSIANHVEAEVNTYVVKTAAVLWTHPETGADSPTLAPGEVKSFEAQFPNLSSDTDAAEVDVWTTPAATTDILANTASDGTGTNLTADITIAAPYKLAERMAIQLTNSATGSDVYLTKIQARGTEATTNNPVIVRSIDTTSQTTYGERKYAAKTPWFPNTTEAQAWCDYQASIYASPLEVVTLTVAADVAAHLTTLSALDISDRITVVANNAAGMGISADYFVEAIAHTLGDGGYNHVVELQLSPVAGGYAQFWLLDVGVLGTSTVPAF